MDLPLTSWDRLNLTECPFPCLKVRLVIVTAKTKEEVGNIAQRQKTYLARTRPWIQFLEPPPKKKKKRKKEENIDEFTDRIVKQRSRL